MGLVQASAQRTLLSRSAQRARAQCRERAGARVGRPSGGPREYRIFCWHPAFGLAGCQAPRMGTHRAAPQQVQVLQSGYARPLQGHRVETERLFGVWVQCCIRFSCRFS